MIRILIASLFLALGACDDDGGGKKHPTPNATPPSSEGWTLEWSEGARIDGNVLQIPAPPGVAGTVTKRINLVGKSRIRLRFSLDRPVTAQEVPESPATITLYFQRAGDNW